MYAQRLTEQMKALSGGAAAAPGLMDDRGELLCAPGTENAGELARRARELLTGAYRSGAEEDGAEAETDTGPERAGAGADDIAAASFAGPDGRTYYVFAAADAGSGAYISDYLRLLAGALGSIGAREKDTEELLEKIVTLAPDAPADAAETGIPEACTGAGSYRVLYVCPAGGAAGRPDQTDDMLAVLENIFPSVQGFVCFPVRRDGAAAVLMPFPEGGDTLADGERYASEAADTVSAEALLDVSVGLSGAFSGTSGLAEGYAQARSAVTAGTVFDNESRCFSYEKLSLERLICSLPKDVCEVYVRETLGDRLLADRSAPQLLGTVKTFLDSSQNGSEAARSLYIHRNTMIYRLEKFQKLTGLDCSGFDAGMRVRIALMVLQYLDS